MKTTLSMLGVWVPIVLTAGSSSAQAVDPSREPPKPRILDASDAPRAVALPNMDGANATAGPVATAPIAPTGEWLYTEESGYVWVPRGSISYAVGNVPSAFLYTPELGWAWYASPWGSGAFTYGPWIGRPWAMGLRAWTQGSGGWALRAAPTHAVAGRVFGVEGHYYDAEGGEYHRGDHVAGGAHRSSGGGGGHDGVARGGGERGRGGEHGGGRGGGHGRR